MSYTLSTIRNRVLEDKLDDVNFSAQTVDNFINDTQRAIFNEYELPFTEKVFSGVLPSGGSLFEFPGDYQVQQSLMVTAPNGEEKDITKNYLGFRQFNSLYPVPAENEAGEPSHWTIHGGKLYLSRPTDDNYTLTLYYIRKPAKLEDDGDVPEIPEEFEEALVLGAYYRCLGRNEDFDQAEYIKRGDYADEINKMLNRYSRKQQGTPTVMRQPLRRRV